MMRAFTIISLTTLGMVGCIPVLESDGDTDISCEDWVAPDNNWADWSTDAPPCLDAQGFNQGQILPDYKFVDQHGDDVSMWQFYGQLIVLDFSTMWCGPCAELALGVDKTWLEFRDEGFMYITVLTQDELSNVPDNEELNKWADDFNITAPVLSDIEEYSTEIIPSNAYPQVMMIGRDMRVMIEAILPNEDAAIHAAVEDAI